MQAEELKQLLAQEFAKLQGTASSSSAKKPRKVLTKEYNEEQYAHQENLLSSFYSVKEALDRKQYTLASEELEEGIKKAKKRMKIIKVADRSKYGWETAKAYMSDDLASDSEDEKKIRRAENEAAKKRKERDEELAKKTKYQRPLPQYRASEGTSTNRQFFRGPPALRTPKYASRCFACGEIGHWRQNCPALHPVPQPEIRAILDKPASPAN